MEYNNKRIDKNINYYTMSNSIDDQIANLQNELKEKKYLLGKLEGIRPFDKNVSSNIEIAKKNTGVFRKSI